MTDPVQVLPWFVTAAALLALLVDRLDVRELRRWADEVADELEQVHWRIDHVAGIATPPRPGVDPVPPVGFHARWRRWRAARRPQAEPVALEPADEAAAAEQVEDETPTEVIEVVVNVPPPVPGPPTTPAADAVDTWTKALPLSDGRVVSFTFRAGGDPAA